MIILYTMYYIYIYSYAFSRRFYPKRLIQAIHYFIFVSMCVPWQWNPQPFVLIRHCHESCPCTPCFSPPEVTRSPHGILHHTNGCTSPKATFPITHCTDGTQLIALITQLIALITNHTADCTEHTLYSLGLPLCHR